MPGWLGRHLLASKECHNECGGTCQGRRSFGSAGYEHESQSQRLLSRSSMFFAILILMAVFLSYLTNGGRWRLRRHTAGFSGHDRRSHHRHGHTHAWGQRQARDRGTETAGIKHQSDKQTVGLRSKDHSGISLKITNEHGLELLGHRDIAKLAYELWQARGCPDGSPDEDWFRAAQQLRSHNADKTHAKT